MRVILTKDIHGLGEEGDIVDIANGYARNYLIPNGKVMEHNTQNISVFKSKLKAIQKRKEEKRLQQMSLKERIEGKIFTITIKTNDKGHLYGSINQTMVAEAFLKEGIEIDKRQLLIPEHTIKSVGAYEVSIKFNQNVSAKFSINIVSENYPNIVSNVQEDTQSQEEVPVQLSSHTEESKDTSPLQGSDSSIQSDEDSNDSV